MGIQTSTGTQQVFKIVLAGLKGEGLLTIKSYDDLSKWSFDFDFLLYVL